MINKQFIVLSVALLTVVLTAMAEPEPHHGYVKPVARYVHYHGEPLSRYAYARHYHYHDPSHEHLIKYYAHPHVHEDYVDYHYDPHHHYHHV